MDLKTEFKLNYERKNIALGTENRQIGPAL